MRENCPIAVGGTHNALPDPLAGGEEGSLVGEKAHCPSP